MRRLADPRGDLKPREVKSSFARIRSTCPSTVRGEMTSDSATARLLMPWAISAAISRSRLVSGDFAGRACADRPAPSARSIASSLPRRT